MTKPINILITGSNYFNCGDDIVREGVMSLLRSICPRPINWWFFNFAATRGNTGRCGEVLNTVELLDITALAPFIDLVVVPGLMVGEELADFYARIVTHGLGPKVIFIGGMNENPYCAQWAGRPLERELLKQSRLIIGRTKKHPRTLDEDGVRYHCLPCPSIFWGDPDPGRGLPNRVGVSIQLPHDHRDGVVNHTTSYEMHHAACEAVRCLAKIKDASVSVVCHHKSEYTWCRREFPDLPVLFSSWFQETMRFYRDCGMIISTRLHAVLGGLALGIPGLVINNSDRHVEALEQFPMVQCAESSGEAQAWFGKYLPWQIRRDFAYRALMYKSQVRSLYEDLLKEYVTFQE